MVDVINKQTVKKLADQASALYHCKGIKIPQATQAILNQNKEYDNKAYFDAILKELGGRGGKSKKKKLHQILRAESKNKSGFTFSRTRYIKDSEKVVSERGDELLPDP